MSAIEHRMANPIDMHIPCCVDNFEEAIALLRASYSEWQNRSK